MPLQKITRNQIDQQTITVLPLLVLTGFMVAYWPVWQQLFSTWSTSDDYSHGFFIIPIIGYILLQKKDVLAAVPQKRSMVGFFTLFTSLAVYVLAYYAEIKTVASLSLISTLAGCILFLYGPYVLKELIFPLFFLLFMIPIPGQIYSAVTIPLQLIVSKTSVAMLSFVGIPILRDGNVIQLPQHSFEVVQACSGLRSLVTLLTLSTIMAYFALRSNVLRAILVLCATPAAVLVNIVRVMVIITMYHFWSYDLTEGTPHTTFGMVIFVLAIAIIYLLRGVLHHWDRSNQ